MLLSGLDVAREAVRGLLFWGLSLMGWAPPPIDWDIVQRMTPEQRAKFLAQERRMLLAGAAYNRSAGRSGLILVLIVLTWWAAALIWWIL